jgi:hypothetical protein
VSVAPSEHDRIKNNDAATFRVKDIMTSLMPLAFCRVRDDVRVMKARCPSFAILTALVLSACTSNFPGSSQEPPKIAATDPAVIASVKAEREASTKVLVLCLMRAAKSLDDRKSDPSTIAEAMMPACSAEFDHNVKVHSRYLEQGLEGEQKVARAVRSEVYDSAIRMVLALSPTNRPAGA